MHTHTHAHTQIHICNAYRNTYRNTYTHTCTHTHTHTHTHRYTHAMHTETHTHTCTHTHIHTPWDCLSTPTLYGRYIYLFNQGRLSNLFTSIEFRPGRRTSRRVNGSQTIAGTWVKRPDQGALYIVYVMCMHEKSLLLACKTNVRDPWPHVVSGTHSGTGVLPLATS